MNNKWKCQIQNLHTHTTYSDGKNTPEEMVLAAIEKGFSSIGFSEHSYISKFEGKWLMPEKTDEYLAELDRLKEKYKSEISIFKGIELDSCSDLSTDNLDYVIGNVHFFPLKDGNYIPYCRSASRAAEDFIFYYNSDTYAFAKDYYDRFVSYFERCNKIDIVGHFDVLTKFVNIHKGLYDFETKEYKNLALDALRAVKNKCDLFEINAGCMSRGTNKEPNPCAFLIKELKNIGARVLVTTDAHSTSMLDKNIDDIFELLLCCGFDSIWILTDHGFEEQKII